MDLFTTSSAPVVTYRDPRKDPQVGDTFRDRDQRVEVTEVWTSATGAVCIDGTRDGQPRAWTLESWRLAMAPARYWALVPAAARS